MNSTLLDQALRLPAPDRLQLADELYRSVDQEVEEEGIPLDLLAELERRDAACEANPATGCTLEELKSRMFRQG